MFGGRSNGKLRHGKALFVGGPMGHPKNGSLKKT